MNSNNDLLSDDSEKEASSNEDQSLYTIDAEIRRMLQLVMSQPSANIKLSKKLLRLISMVIDRADKQIQSEENTSQVKSQYSSDEISRCLSVINSIANNTILVPSLLQLDIACKIVPWLNHSSNFNFKNRRYLIMILHNISRHDDGADQLNKYDAIKTIKQFQNSDDIKANVTASLPASLALALLSTPEELKSGSDSIHSVLDQLLQLTIRAASSSEFQWSSNNIDFHISEFLAVLVKLFVVDETTLDYVLCQAQINPPSDMSSNIQLFANLLVSFAEGNTSDDSLQQFTCIALFNIIWSISFQARYRHELANNNKLMSTIKNVVNKNFNENVDQYKPRSMETIYSASRSIMHNLGEDSPSMSPGGRRVIDQSSTMNTDNTNAVTPSPLSKLGAKQSVMISYSHQNNEFCDKILDLLATKSNNFDVWIDRTHCQTGDLWEAIADGMECSQVIICLISDNYFQSKSCRQEMTYALDNLRKPIIPIYLGEYQPRGWIGIRVTGMKYIRCRNVDQPEDKRMSELMEMILKLLNSEDKDPNVNKTAMPVVHHEDIKAKDEYSRPSTNQDTPQNKPTPMSAPNDKQNIEQNPSPKILPESIDQWTQKDIHSWFAENYILDELRDLYHFRTGEEILDYADELVDHRDKHRETYEDLFSKKYHGAKLPPHEFIRFAKALERLRNNNLSKLVLPMKEQPSTSTTSTKQKSSTCVIL